MEDSAFLKASSPEMHRQRIANRGRGAPWIPDAPHEKTILTVSDSGDIDVGRIEEPEGGPPLRAGSDLCPGGAIGFGRHVGERARWASSTYLSVRR